MANEISIKAVTKKFSLNLNSILQFVREFTGDRKGVFVFYIYDYAIIKVYKDFEELLLNTIVGLINQEAPYISTERGLHGKKSLTKQKAEQLFIGNTYFSFKGSKGLLKDIKTFFPTSHWFVILLSDTKYNKTFSLLIPLRNFAAHSSKVAKQRAIKAVGMQQLGYSGSWLKVNNRFGNIIEDLREIALKIEENVKF